MKKTAKLNKLKLKLKTETVRPLKAGELKQAAGGMLPNFIPTEKATCTCKCGG